MSITKCIIAILFLGLISCHGEEELGCFLQKFYIKNESGSNVQVFLFDRKSNSDLVMNEILDNGNRFFFHETEGGHCLVENNFVGDSLIFVFENQKKNIFSCMNEAEFPFHVVYNNNCYTTLSDKNALYSHFFTRIDDGTTDLYYIITRLDYALAE